MLAQTIESIKPLDPTERAAVTTAAATAARAATVLFAGDHGVRTAALGPVPADATARLVTAALDAAPVTVVDVGVAAPLEPREGLVVRKVRAGTRDFTAEPALTRDEVLAAVEIGIGEADNAVDEGAGALIAGGIGVGGTAPALALIASLTVSNWDDLSWADHHDDTHAEDARTRTVTAVKHGLARHRPDSADPLGVLAVVGGLEHAALAGFILGAAAHRVPVVIEGPVGESAATVAAALAPASTGVVVTED
jgi:nicotinate-nucleotide--dimethylbenzimidazole phosphoribosyltransferase